VFVLRCYGITLAPLVVYGVLLWGAGLAGGYVLSFHGLGPWPAVADPAAFWLTSAAALAVVALLFGAMLWRAVSRPSRA
jgi:MATE family multidrug resistance protein